MLDKVIIVELFVKLKIILSYFNDEVIVLLLVGYIRDLVIFGKGGLGVDVDNNFEFIYKIIIGKGKLIIDLKKKIKGKEVLIVIDLDCEGEVIVWYIVDELGLDLNEYNCIVFKEIIKFVVMEVINYKC